jgi:hypothetical protein
MPSDHMWACSEHRVLHCWTECAVCVGVMLLLVPAGKREACCCQGLTCCCCAARISTGGVEAYRLPTAVCGLTSLTGLCVGQQCAVTSSSSALCATTLEASGSSLCVLEARLYA